MPRAQGCAGAANVQDVRYAAGAGQRLFLQSFCISHIPVGQMRRSGECTGCTDRKLLLGNCSCIALDCSFQTQFYHLYPYRRTTYVLVGVHFLHFRRTRMCKCRGGRKPRSDRRMPHRAGIDPPILLHFLLPWRSDVQVPRGHGAQERPTSAVQGRTNAAIAGCNGAALWVRCAGAANVQNI